MSNSVGPAISSSLRTEIKAPCARISTTRLLPREDMDPTMFDIGTTEAGEWAQTLRCCKEQAWIAAPLETVATEQRAVLSWLQTGRCCNGADTAASRAGGMSFLNFLMFYNTLKGRVTCAGQCVSATWRRQSLCNHAMGSGL